jgi:hypothetical protein
MAPSTLPVASVESTATISNRVRRISDKTAKRYVRYLQVLFVVSFVVLTVQSVWVQTDFSTANARAKILGINIACGSICLGMIGVYGAISYLDWRRNLVLAPDIPTVPQRWCLGGRRPRVPSAPARYFQLVLFDFLLIFLVTMLFMGMSVYLVVEECGWMRSSTEIVAFVKWTLFNGIVANQFCHILSLIPRESLVTLVRRTRTGWYFRWRKIELTDGVDMPTSVYVFVFVCVFIAPFACILFGMLQSLKRDNEHVIPEWAEGEASGLSPEVCDPFSPLCQRFIDSRFDSWSTGRTMSMIIASAVIIANLMVYIVCLLLLARALQPMAYRRFKLLRVILGYHIMTRIPSSVLLILNFIFLWLIEIGSCPVEFMANAGFGSLILALIGISSASLWLTTPVGYGTDHADGEVAFDESRPYDRDKRISYERMMQAFVFSFVVYEVDEVETHQQLFGLEEYLGLYGIEDYDVLWNKSVDSKCMMAWNSDTRKIVIAFRGTASGRNVLSDLKIWREPHEPETGNYWLGTKPMIHAGFSEYFYRSGMREDCLNRIQTVMGPGGPGGPGGECGSQKTAKKWDILVCGHSLGAAAAKIAAFDISEWLAAKGVSYNLSCYTYGCPRVGNRSFVRRYEEIVPDSWNIMHLDDVVTKGSKFVYMFKRDGHRCFLTKGGPIVQPSFMTRVTLRGIHRSIQQHLLPSYAESLVLMVTQHGIIDWSSPDKQRIRLAIMNSKVFKHMQKSFCTEKRAIDLARKRVIDLDADDGDNAGEDDNDIDLATGLTGIRRINSTVVSRRRAAGADYPL